MADKITFWALVRTVAGRLRITRNTGHMLIADDLKIGTPSVDTQRAR